MRIEESLGSKCHLSKRKDPFQQIKPIDFIKNHNPEDFPGYFFYPITL